MSDPLPGTKRKVRNVVTSSSKKTKKSSSNKKKHLPALKPLKGDIFAVLSAEAKLALVLQSEPDADYIISKLGKAWTYKAVFKSGVSIKNTLAGLADGQTFMEAALFRRYQVLTRRKAIVDLAYRDGVVVAFQRPELVPMRPIGDPASHGLWEIMLSATGERDALPTYSLLIDSKTGCPESHSVQVPGYQRRADQMMKREQCVEFLMGQKCAESPVHHALTRSDLFEPNLLDMIFSFVG
jgi:hypothetical protein